MEKHFIPSNVLQSYTKSNQYFYNMFKTEKARMLAKEIDDYIYSKSPYKEEVEDYHNRYKNGIRTDCIGYISKKGTYKFATNNKSKESMLRPPLR